MTAAAFFFKPQPDIADLFKWREQLSGSLTYGLGKASIEFEVEVTDDCFNGETREAWEQWCEIEVNQHVREFCPELDSGDVKGATLKIVPEEAPDDVQEQEDCDRWARSAGLRNSGRDE